MTVDLQVRTFLAVLNAGWRAVETLSEETGLDLTSDWAQANWEMLVEFERAIGGELNLEVYGDGADFPGSSRVSRPSVLPNAAVVCHAKKDGRVLVDALTGMAVKDGQKLDAFCTIKEGWVHIEPPFDHAVLFTEPKQVVAVADVRFSIRKY